MVRFTPASSVAALALLGSSVAATASEPPQPRVNGWYPCAFSTELVPNGTIFECAEIQVPLCYDGVCASDRQISLFAKRRLARNATEPRKAAILLQGGPGAASPAMEATMISLLKQQSADSVDFYTFDHRGTGRSEFLQCEAAQVSTPGSDGAKEITLPELQACLHDLNFQYDDQAAAFSTTSAAMDARTLITTFMADAHVFVAGFSYGTYLTQRILQLQIPQVKGYIFDGVDVLTTGKDAIDSANSNWNAAIHAASRRLLEFCFDDAQCPLMFQSRETVLEDTLALLDKLDAEKESNACAIYISEVSGYDLPSVGLRMAMSALVRSNTERASALAMLGHVQRCKDDDLAALKTTLDKSTSQSGSNDGSEIATLTDPLTDLNSLLYSVIVFSERYRQPAPTQAERDEAFFGGPFSMDAAQEALTYCVFSGSTDPACEERRSELPTGNATFFYPHDKYINDKLALPAEASALVINGGLDFQTPLEFGELLYDKLTSSGSGKGVMMVNFDYGTHCGGEGVAESPTAPCRDSIVAQFITQDGAVDKVDANCMTELPETVFHAIPTNTK